MPSFLSLSFYQWCRNRKGQEGNWPPPQYLADQLTLFQPWGADSAHPLLVAPPMFFTFRHHWKSLWGSEVCSFEMYLTFIKFIYSEKATKFCKILTLLLSNVVTVKSKVKIFQNFVAFSEYMNFIRFASVSVNPPVSIRLGSSVSSIVEF